MGRTSVKDCESGSFTVDIDVESASDSYKTAFYITIIISSVLVVAIVWLIIKQNCSSSKNEDEFDPELAPKRQPEFKPEISLKTMDIPEIDSNQDSGTFYENVWENTTTSPHGEKLPTQ